MSFILDALKKSENDRQSQAEAEFATIPSSPDAAATPRWLWVLGALLVINALVLFAFIRRTDEPSLPAPSQASLPTAGPATLADIAPDPTSNQRSGSDASFASQLEDVRRQQSEVVEPESGSAQSTAGSRTAAAAQPRPAVSVANLRVSHAATLPTLMELRMNGTLQLPDLHLDIHVFNNVPANRFVFIDMNKYQENSQLDAGPTVREITSDGVILVYQDIAFLLPRE